MKNKPKVIIGGIIPVLVGLGFMIGACTAISDGYVSEGRRYNKIKYTKKDNPKEFNRIVGGLFMIGSVAFLVGAGLIAIAVTGKEKSN